MPTCADVAPIAQALSVLIAGAPIHAGALTVVPLLAPPGGEPDWLTLAEAGDAVAVTEVSEAGAVLAAAGATLTISVSCVEQGRWARRSERFTSSDVSLYAFARRKKAARVSESLRRHGGHRADQGEVWRDVAARAGQAGAAVWIAGAWAGLELLAAPGLFARAWPRLASGYVADAIGREPRPSFTADLADVRHAILRATAEPAPAVGLGAEQRLGGTDVVGAALVVGERVAHLMAFPA
ncbi:MAG: hypothetical protein HYR51_13360 [Candidatus Rokubacteria bacterium]|nr:hypothetical protein [Candidatus Rokubacteria bacterium]